MDQSMVELNQKIDALTTQVQFLTDQAQIAERQRADRAELMRDLTPIANEAFGGDALQVIFTIFFIASVLAPLTEEIMFRGVLYRTLRDGSRRSSRVVSILFAALISSLIFAAIHPQGIVGIPVLTILAFGFCLVRQWRGSLIACITMHAIHNGLTMSLLIPLII